MAEKALGGQVLDTTSLRYFIVVARMQHMTKAAQHLNITQPALSASIRRLEAETGFQLFDRNGRGIQLSQYGRVFLEAVTQVDDILTQSLQDMEELRRSEHSFVRLCGALSEVNARLIDELLDENIRVRVDITPDDWEMALLRGSCDVVVTFGRPKGKSLDETLLCNHKIVVVCGTEHPLAKTGSIEPQELNNYPFCSTTAAHSIMNMSTPQLQQLGMTPIITFMGRNSQDVIRGISNGRRLALMVEKNLSPRDGCVVLPVKGFDVQLPIYMYLRKGGTSSPELAMTKQKIIELYGSLYDRK